MKKRIILIASIAVIVLSYFLYKKWVYDSMGWRQPQRESLKSISDFSKTQKFPGILVVAKDINAANFFQQRFDVGMCYLLDGNKNVITDNIGDGATCYRSMVKGIIDNFNYKYFEKSNYDHGQSLYDSLIKSSVILGDSLSAVKAKFDYIFIYGWAKYCGASYKDHPMKLKQYLDTQTRKRVLVLAVNNDYVNNWFGDTSTVPKTNNIKLTYLMKLIALISLLCLAANGSIASTTIRTTVDAGRKSKGCNGLGICTIKTTAGESDDNAAVIVLSDDGMQLTMTLSQGFIESKEGQIANGKFIQQEDYALSREICAALKSLGGIVIPAGQYPSSLSNGKYTVRFSVTDTPTGTH